MFVHNSEKKRSKSATIYTDGTSVFRGLTEQACFKEATAKSHIWQVFLQNMTKKGRWTTPA